MLLFFVIHNKSIEDDDDGDKNDYDVNKFDQQITKALTSNFPVRLENKTNKGKLQLLLFLDFYLFRMTGFIIRI